METTSSKPSSYDLLPPPTGDRPEPKRRWGWMFVMAVLSALFLFGLYECGTGLVGGMKSAEAGIAQLHERYNREAYNEIIDESDPRFQTLSRQDLLKFFNSVHRKLGPVLETKRTFVNVNATTEGTFVRATFSTKFERAEGVETVVWRRDRGELRLVGYNIQSNALVTD
jgi:uncharacterized protein DUF4019